MGESIIIHHPASIEVVSDSRLWKLKMDKNPAPAKEQSEEVQRQEGPRHVDQEGAREVPTDATEQIANLDLNDHQPPNTETMAGCKFDKLFSVSVPHVCERIFLSLDYTSFKKCADVCRFWKDLLTSESYQKLGKPIFRGSIHGELKLAILSGQTEEVRRILSNGMVDMNYSTEEAPTPLYLAVMAGQKEIVQLLLEKGADSNKLGSINNTTPLMKASVLGHLDVVQLLLDGGANPNYAVLSHNIKYTSLYVASTKGHLDVVRLLLDKGAKFNEESPVSELHMAAANGHIGVVQLLLSRGAEVNRADFRGRTPLRIAQACGQTEVCEILEENGGIV